MSQNDIAVVPPDRPLQERFAKAYFDRRFRLGEAALECGISDTEAVDLIRSPAVVAHLDRLASTGELAVAPMGAGEMQEAVSRIARMTKADWAADCAVGGVEADPRHFSMTKIAALKLLYQMKVGPAAKMAARRKASKKAAAAAVKRIIGAADVVDVDSTIVEN